jgi:hypothetical protein
MRVDLFPKTTEGKLAHVEEECGEVIKALGKLHRFGETATDPKTGITYDNVVDLHEELKQLNGAIERYLGDFL